MTSAARSRVVVVGGGLAGITAALRAADLGAEVVLLERRGRLGGLTWSFERKGLVFDNGQHVFLRCCTAYRGLLDRIGAADQVHLQPLLDVPVLAPGGRRARIARSAHRLPSPLHLAPSLLGYGHLSVIERVRLSTAVSALRKLAVADPALDHETFGAWLRRHGQSAHAIERLWDLVVLPTVNVRAREASLALAAMVFRTGLLDTVDGADIGWATVPLGTLHAESSMRALERAGVEVMLGASVQGMERRAGEGAVVTVGERRIEGDAAIVAVAHEAAAALLPARAIDDLSGLGHSPIVNVHLVLDRTVTDLALCAAVGSPVQYVFDRTVASGLAESGPRGSQCLVVSISAATRCIGTRPEELVRSFHEALGELFPRARDARLIDAVVTREHTATFRGVPGTAALRPSAATRAPGIYVAGAWCATGWPATMESAVRSGTAAADAAMAGLGAVGMSLQAEGIPA